MSDITKQSYLNKARKDKFLMVFDVPPILKPIISEYIRDNEHINPNSVQFSIFGTLVPQITIKGTESRFSGSTLYTSSHSKDAFPPVNIKFTVDSMYDNYWVIYQWLNLLHDQKDGTYNAHNIPIDKNFNDYMTNITIYALDEYKKKRMKFTYIKAFPTSVDELTFNYKADTGEELESGVTFLYSQMHVERLSEI